MPAADDPPARAREPGRPSAPAGQLREVGQTLVAAGLIAAAALWLYRPVLVPSDPAERYPWSSDAWGHLLKVEFLASEIERGNLFPDILPGWYNGVQFLRYYGPLPYYLLVLLLRLTGDVFVAGNWFLLGCALLGAGSFLLFRRRIGLLPAAAGGVLALLLPDHLRVAFAEGNLPRVLASALLPIALWLLLNVLDGKSRRRDVVALALLTALIVLTHAMMAAIFVVALGLFTLVYWRVAGLTARPVGRALAGLGTGLGLAGWWLLPSLSGGITEIDGGAASEAVASFPLTASLNPALRLEDGEAFYLGVGFVLAVVLTLRTWRRASVLARSLLPVGLAAALISSTALNPIYQSLPLHQLLWPARFLSFGGFALLLGSMALGRSGLSRRAFVALALALALDFLPSQALVHGRPPRTAVAAAAEHLREPTGWRVATADLSRLGSAPSYLFTALSGREQVFGWAYQGTTTAPTLAGINFALSQGYPAYAVDRLDLLGADDVIVLRGSVPESFPAALEQGGYRLDRSLGDLDLYHRDGGPRAFALQLDVLGIGEGANSLAYLFPRVVVGPSSAIDDYDPAFLRKFRAIVLSRFGWRQKGDAERLIVDYAAAGGRVIVDLTGAPEDVLARKPKFLDVYAEPLVLEAPPTLERGAERIALRPFAPGDRPWHTHTPQGLDDVAVGYHYLGDGADGVVLGSKRIGASQVTFVGMNLAFYALRTGDPSAIALLGEAIGLGEPAPLGRQAVPLQDYAATSRGYRFGYRLERPADLLVPVAHHDGTVVRVDGQRVATVPLSRLVLIEAPSGEHVVEITTEPTALHWLGLLVSGLAALCLIALADLRRAAPRRGINLAVALALSLAALAGRPAGVAAAAPIVLDSNFGDWAGQACVADPAGDAAERGDVVAFCWATNADEPTVYFMVERSAGSTLSAGYSVAIDANNNGIFGEPADRVVVVDYRPGNNVSQVDVTVTDGLGVQISQSLGNDWGETRAEGARRVEFRASFADLGISAGQGIRMSLTSKQGDRVPDSGDVQWSPVPALGALVVLLVAVGAMVAQRTRRRTAGPREGA